MPMANRTVTNPGVDLKAAVQVPGDKSLSHRSLLFAAIASGDSLVTGLGPGIVEPAEHLDPVACEGHFFFAFA